MARGTRKQLTSTDLLARFIQLRASGLSYVEIGNELGVSKSTICNWVNQFEARIASARALELDNLQHAYYMAHSVRVKLIGEHLQSVLNELAKRDLSELSTHSLYSLMLSLMDKQDVLYIEPTPLSDNQIELIDGTAQHV